MTRPKRYGIQVKGQRYIEVGTAEAAMRELSDLRERGVPPSHVKTTFNAALLREYVEQERKARNVTIRTVSERSHAGVKKPSVRASKPRRSGRDMGGDVVQERGRRHLRLW